MSIDKTKQNNLCGKITERLSNLPSTITFDTSTCFDTSHIPNEMSSISRFMKESTELNKKISNDLDRYHSNMLLLAYVGLVESFIRELFRKIILVDASAKEECEIQLVTYHAAINSSPELLPDSILEKFSFVSHKSISEAMRDVLGVKGSFPSSLLTSIEQFEKVCHLRHCIVHRFGYLGNSNIVKLGSQDHSSLLQKPVNINLANLQAVSIICNNLVKELNHFLMTWFLSSTVFYKYVDWDWSFEKDREIFSRYFELFYEEDFVTNKELLMERIYNHLKTVAGE